MTTQHFDYPSFAGRGPNVFAGTLDSATTATGSALGTWTGNLKQFSNADVYVSVTAASGTSATLSLYLDTSFDGIGTVNLARFADIVTGTARRVMHLARVQTGTTMAVVSDAGAGTVRPLGWGDTIRIRRNITGTSPSFSYSVYVVAVG